MFSKPVKFTILEILLGCIHVDKLHFYAIIILFSMVNINKQKKKISERNLLGLFL